jgi:hypothetical protein
MRRRDLIRTLQEELEFFEEQGYGHTFRSLWRPTLLFRDSPICLNCRTSDPLLPCIKCRLIQFVPEQKRDLFMPCHHIPLDRARNTIAQLYRTGTQQNLDLAFRAWLYSTIEKLEKEELLHENS